MQIAKKVIPVYLLQNEHEEFKSICKKEGLTMSAVLRAMALVKINKAKRESEA